MNNVKVMAARTGIQVDGTASNPANGITISNSAIGSAGTSTTYIGYSGITVTNTTNLTISRDSIYNIITANTNPPAILLGAGVTNALISRNMIDSIRYTGTNGYGGRGILVGTGSTASNITISNNMISRIGGDGWSGFNSDNIIGIGIGTAGSGLSSTTGGVNVYNNSISLSQVFAGYPTGTNSFGLYVSSVGSGLDIRNNIITNTSVNTSSSSAKSYGFASQAASTAFTQLNYNDYYVGGSQGVLANFGGVDQTSLSALQTATGKDVKSVNRAVNFTSTADLHLTGSSVGDTLLKAAPLTAVTVDFDGQTRSATWVYMGADEVPSSPLPVNLLTFTARAFNENANLRWSTASERNLAYFAIERSADEQNFTEIGRAPASNSNRVASYSYDDVNAKPYAASGILYYRLRMADADGRTTYSQAARVDFNAALRNTFAFTPNPFVDVVTVTAFMKEKGEASVVVTDMNGRPVVTKKVQLDKGDSYMQLPETAALSQGFYIITIEAAGETTTSKLLKIK